MANGKMNKNKYPSRFEEMEKRAKQVGRVIAFLTREQLDFIDKISKDALFSTGRKLSRTAIIQVIIEAIRKLDLSGNDIHSADELEHRILDMAKKSLTNLSDAVAKERSDQSNLEKGAKHETD